MNKLEEKFKHLVYPYMGSSFMTGDEFPEAIEMNARECANITKEISCKFLAYCFDKRYTRYADSNETNFWIKEHESFEAKTTKEVFEEFLKTL